MEQHPVPQNITGFQFKLIGDMTIKQFGFLAGGIIVGYFITLFPGAQVIKIPFALLSGFIGFAIAFMPLEERSLDRWFVAFFKAIYAPTQFIWKKIPVAPDWLTITTVAPAAEIPKEERLQTANKLQEYLNTLPSTPQLPIDKMESSAIRTLDFSVGDNLMPPPAQAVSFPPAQIIKEEEQEPLPKVRVRKLKASLKGEIIFPMEEQRKKITNIELPSISLPDMKTSKVTAKKEMPQIINVTVLPTSADLSYKSQRILGKEKIVQTPPPILPPQPLPVRGTAGPDRDEVRKLKDQNEQLSVQLKRFQEQIDALQEFAVQTSEGKLRLKEMLTRYEDAQKQKDRALEELTNLKRKSVTTVRQAVTPTNALPQATPRVQYVTQSDAKKQGIPLSIQFPNVVGGIVTDKNGDLLPGTIITVKDNRENPIRALKTNQLGQFKTGTPLANGTYTIELEKEGFDFDIIAIEAKGGIIPSLDIKAK